MNKPMRIAVPALVGGAVGAALLLPAAGASAAAAASYQADLKALNHSTASGTLMLTLSGNQATVTEHVTGLAAKFGDAAYPHVQHVHIGRDGQLPDHRRGR